MGNSVSFASHIREALSNPDLGLRPATPKRDLLTAHNLSLTIDQEPLRLEAQNPKPVFPRYTDLEARNMDKVVGILGTVSHFYTEPMSPLRGRTLR